MNDALTQARAELAWYFTSAGQVLGLKAVALDGGGGSQVYDEARSHRDHMQRRRPEHRRDLQRVESVEDAMRQLDFADVMTLRRGFTPYGAARATWKAQSVFAEKGRQLFALVLALPDTVLAWRVAKSTTRRPTHAELRDWLERETESTNERSLTPGMAKLREAASRALDTSTALFAAQWSLLVREARDEREALLKHELELLHIRLWGAP